MKNLFKIIACASLMMTSANMVSAQSAASSSKDVTPPADTTYIVAAQDSMIPMGGQAELRRSTRGIPTPSHIEQMFKAGQVQEAFAEFEKFKKSQDKTADKFHLRYLEMTLYWQAMFSDTANRSLYEAKQKELRKQLLNEFPNVSDVYLLQIDENTTPEERLALAKKAVAADPKNEEALIVYVSTLFQLGKNNEACAELEKLSDEAKQGIPQRWQCK